MYGGKKTVLITGASRGIGASLAENFAAQSYNVVINYNSSKDEAMELLKKIRSFGGSAIALKANVSDFAEAKYLVEKSEEEFGSIDVLVNNAGIASQKMFTDITEKDWKLMFDVNVHGMFNCTHHAVKNMIKKHSGKIINISSMWGLTGSACEVHYSASKAAVIGFTKALAKELGTSGVQVNCVAPGLIDTAMNSGFSENDIKKLIEETPCSRIGTVQDVSNVVLFLASSESDFITGEVINVNGGFLT